MQEMWAAKTLETILAWRTLFVPETPEYPPFAFA